MEFRNDITLEEEHTIVYGHRMKDGSMFAGLNQYLDFQSLEDMLLEIEVIGSMHNRSKEAEELIKSLEQQLSQSEQKVEGREANYQSHLLNSTKLVVNYLRILVFNSSRFHLMRQTILLVR